ncbi:MAG TPA: hypothetical protein VGO67_05305 [Verrucomicrobiae bacterium]|jgi:hypothetical protein
MMTREEAQRTLLLYRPGTSDAEEPDIAEALNFAKQDAELSRWLEQHCAQQSILREKIRQIPVPVGLKEQIISERPKLARERVTQRVIAMALAVVAVLFVCWRAGLIGNGPSADENFAVYRTRMISAALRGYAMDFESSDPAKIREYLVKEKVAKNYELPNGLQKAVATGCAVEDWDGTKVALLCFSDSGPQSAGGKSDLWLFVVDRNAVKEAPANDTPQFAKVNKLITASWSHGGKLYLLGSFGDEQAIRRWF